MNEQDKTMWTVCDKNAKTGARVHDVPVLTDDETKEVLATHEYRLSAQTPTPMPPDHAMFFLKARAKPPVGVSRGSEGIEEVSAADLDRMGLAA